MAKPTPDITSVKKVRSLRSKGLSYREISRVIQKDLKSIYRWAHYDVGDLEKLSTQKH